LSKKVSKKCYLLIGSEISRSEKESIPSDKEVSSESSDDDCIFDLSDAAARKREQRKLQKSLRRRKARESLPVTCAVPASSCSVEIELVSFPSEKQKYGTSSDVEDKYDNNLVEDAPPERKRRVLTVYCSDDDDISVEVAPAARKRRHLAVHSSDDDDDNDDDNNDNNIDVDDSKAVHSSDDDDDNDDDNDDNNIDVDDSKAVRSSDDENQKTLALSGAKRRRDRTTFYLNRGTNNCFAISLGPSRDIRFSRIVETPASLRKVSWPICEEEVALTCAALNQCALMAPEWSDYEPSIKVVLLRVLGMWWATHCGYHMSHDSRKGNNADKMYYVKCDDCDKTDLHVGRIYVKETARKCCISNISFLHKHAVACPVEELPHSSSVKKATVLQLSDPDLLAMAPSYHITLAWPLKADSDIAASQLQTVLQRFQFDDPMRDVRSAIVSWARSCGYNYATIGSTIRDSHAYFKYRCAAGLGCMSCINFSVTIDGNVAITRFHPVHNHKPSLNK
jgi:hypothetical protein